MKELEPMKVYTVQDFNNHVMGIYATMTDALNKRDSLAEDGDYYFIEENWVVFPSFRDMFEISENLRKRMEKYAAFGKAIQSAEEKFMDKE